MHFLKTPKRTRKSTGKKIDIDFSVTTDDFNDYITLDETNDSCPDNNKIKLNVVGVYISCKINSNNRKKYILQLQEEINLIKTETSHCEKVLNAKKCKFYTNIDKTSMI